MSRNTIPLGWINCPNAGTVVADKFIAFKTPLSSEFDNRMSKDCRWNTGSVFDYLKERNIQMGLWIDLTNTERYFQKAAVEKEGTQYVKLKVGGGGEVPSPLAVAEFNSHCRQFFRGNPNAVIGVHCTHGFNRTGYLICSFLAGVIKQNIHEAFTEFSTARPPGIYRQGYVSSLWKMFPSPDLPSIPSVEEPGWSQRRVNNPNWRVASSVPSAQSMKRHTSGLPITGAQRPQDPERRQRQRRRDRKQSDMDRNWRAESSFRSGAITNRPTSGSGSVTTVSRTANPHPRWTQQRREGSNVNNRNWRDGATSSRWSRAPSSSTFTGRRTEDPGPASNQRNYGRSS